MVSVMQMQDLEALKDIPGYTAILRAVLKSLIQGLVEQLSERTGEESVVLTASVTDGTLCHLGSNSGKTFLTGREEFKSQFLTHCIKRHHSEINTTAESPRLAKKRRDTYDDSLGVNPAESSPGMFTSEGSPSMYNTESSTKNWDVPSNMSQKRGRKRQKTSSFDNSMAEQSWVRSSPTDYSTKNQSETSYKIHTVYDQSAEYDSPLSGQQTSADNDKQGPSLNRRGSSSLVGQTGSSSNDHEQAIDNLETETQSEPVVVVKQEHEDSAVAMTGTEQAGTHQLEPGTSNEPWSPASLQMQGYNVMMQGTNGASGESLQPLANVGSTGEMCDTEYEDVAQQQFGVNADERVCMYRCCGKTFQDALHLQKHKSNPTHGGARPFVCGMCGKTFATARDLRRHEKVEKREFCVVCGYCGKQFATKSALRQHEGTHRSDRGYRCHCGKGFKHPSSLARHKLVHRNPEQQIVDQE